MTGTRPLLLITGIADGFGASIAKLFAASGHDILGLSRGDSASERIGELVGQQGGSYAHRPCDITQPDQVAAALGPDTDRVRVFIHNAHSLTIGASADTTLGEFERAWRVACFGAMTVAKLVLPAMAARGDGAIIFSGATASLRGGANFSAFASAKFALRGLAQSLARECGPRGIHVAHVVIDGLIEEAQTQERFGRSQAMRIDPDRIAQIYLEIVRQHPSAWTHELDLRPHGEGF
jgi:NAD(P)-dependent dehydrogenase (short-subunit alcohol dehydrogenase family)